MFYIALVGNLTEGYTAYGWYETFAEAAEAHDFEECWIMEVRFKQHKIINQG